jgi:hypothetical protein
MGDIGLDLIFETPVHHFVFVNKIYGMPYWY